MWPRIALRPLDHELVLVAEDERVRLEIESLGHLAALAGDRISPEETHVLDQLGPAQPLEDSVDLAHLDREVSVEVVGQPTTRLVIDALEASYPMLKGTIRDPVTQKRRPFVRFFACEEDLSHDSPDAPLPEAVVTGTEPFFVVGAMAGG